MKITKRQRKYLLIGIAITAAIWSIVGGKILAASLLQAADNSGDGTNPSWERGFVCSQSSEFCYAWGGGTSTTNDVATTYRYDPVMDSWSSIPIVSLPRPRQFDQYASGDNADGLMIAMSSSGDAPANASYLYNESLNSFSELSPPVGFNAGSGFTGTVVGNIFYVMRASGNIFTAYSLDMENPGDGWNSNQDAYTDVTLLQWAKSVYDPVNQVIVIITRDNGLTWIYDINTGELTDGISSTFPPCTGAGTVCIPSVMMWDANLGVIAGKQGTPTSTSIGLYQFDVTNQEWSSSTAEILNDADFNYLAFTNIAPMNASYTIDGITTTMFGGGVATSSTPGIAASEWFIRTGDPGGVTTTRNDFDSWLDHFLSGIGMNSDLGKLLVGSLFVGIIFLVLEIRGVPWIVSLAVSGIAVVMLTAASVFSATILLSLMALVMFAGILMLMSLIFGRGGDG